MKSPNEYSIFRPHFAQGFTLIELVVTLFLLSLLFMIVFPALENLSPTYKIRSIAREIGDMILESRSNSLIKGETFGIRYDFDHQRFGMVYPKNYGSKSGPEREVLNYTYLGRDVRLISITYPDGKEVSSGVVDIDFEPLGGKGSHILLLSTPGNKRKFWIKFNEFSGLLTYSEGKELNFLEYRP